MITNHDNTHYSFIINFIETLIIKYNNFYANIHKQKYYDNTYTSSIYNLFKDQLPNIYNAINNIPFVFTHNEYPIGSEIYEEIDYDNLTAMTERYDMLRKNATNNKQLLILFQPLYSKCIQKHIIDIITNMNEVSNGTGSKSEELEKKCIEFLKYRGQTTGDTGLIPLAVQEINNQTLQCVVRLLSTTDTTYFFTILMTVVYVYWYKESNVLCHRNTRYLTIINSKNPGQNTKDLRDKDIIYYLQITSVIIKSFVNLNISFEYLTLNLYNMIYDYIMKIYNAKKTTLYKLLHELVDIKSDNSATSELFNLFNIIYNIFIFKYNCDNLLFSRTNSSKTNRININFNGIKLDEIDSRIKDVINSNFLYYYNNRYSNYLYEHMIINNSIQDIKNLFNEIYNPDELQDRRNYLQQQIIKLLKIIKSVNDKTNIKSDDKYAIIILSKLITTLYVFNLLDYVSDTQFIEKIRKYDKYLPLDLNILLFNDYCYTKVYVNDVMYIEKYIEQKAFSNCLNYMSIAQKKYTNITNLIKQNHKSCADNITFDINDSSIYTTSNLLLQDEHSFINYYKSVENLLQVRNSSICMIFTFDSTDHIYYYTGQLRLELSGFFENNVNCYMFKSNTDDNTYVLDIMGCYINDNQKNHTLLYAVKTENTYIDCLSCTKTDYQVKGIFYKNKLYSIDNNLYSIYKIPATTFIVHTDNYSNIYLLNFEFNLDDNIIDYKTLISNFSKYLQSVFNISNDLLDDSLSSLTYFDKELIYVAFLNIIAWIIISKQVRRYKITNNFKLYIKFLILKLHKIIDNAVTFNEFKKIISKSALIEHILSGKSVIESYVTINSNIMQNNPIDGLLRLFKNHQIDPNHLNNIKTSNSISMNDLVEDDIKLIDDFKIKQNKLYFKTKKNIKTLNILLKDKDPRLKSKSEHSESYGKYRCTLVKLSSNLTHILHTDRKIYDLYCNKLIQTGFYYYKNINGFEQDNKYKLFKINEYMTNDINLYNCDYNLNNHLDKHKNLKELNKNMDQHLSAISRIIKYDTKFDDEQKETILNHIKQQSLNDESDSIIKAKITYFVNNHVYCTDNKCFTPKQQQNDNCDSQINQFLINILNIIIEELNKIKLQHIKSDDIINMDIVIDGKINNDDIKQLIVLCKKKNILLCI